MSQVVNVNESDLSDLKSNAGSKVGLNFDKEGGDLFNLATDVGRDQIWQKKDKKTSQTDALKHAKLSNKIFDYIHIACYRKQLFLAWYDNLTYV